MPGKEKYRCQHCRCEQFNIHDEKSQFVFECTQCGQLAYHAKPYTETAGFASAAWPWFRDHDGKSAEDMSRYEGM